MMQDIIAPVPVELIEKELTEERFLRVTNSASNEIYVVNAHNAPNTMREIGRLREISFREAGGGTGLDCDIDAYDTCKENYFSQLIVWNPAEKVIVGGYRFLMCDHLPLDENGQVDTPTSELFYYSERFVKDYLPKTIELGRSFVQPDYQPSKDLRRGLFSLDNLWDGLAALWDLYPEAKYFFGKVTIYSQRDRMSRDMILYVMKKHFPDTENLVHPRPEFDLPIVMDAKELEETFTHDNYRDDLRVLNKIVRERGAAVPPLVGAYMNLSSTMRSFGTSLNPPFGNVEETGILVTIGDMYEDKVERHLKYEKNPKFRL